jgi:hypothetical protein
MSTSLLEQLGVKQTLVFVDTSNPPPEPSPPGVSTWSIDAGLAAIGFERGSPYIAPLGEKDRLAPKPFSEWWTATILQDHQGNEFSRKGLTLALAQLDGGVQVDPALEEAYAALSRSNSLGFEFHVGDERLPDESPVPANVRQVAYELQATIDEQLANLIV